MASELLYNNLDWYTSNISEEFVDRLRNRHELLVLFGAGELGRQAVAELSKVDIKPDYFCDNDPQRHGTTYLGIPVISFDDLSNMHKESLVVITSLVYKMPIKKQLSESNMDEFVEKFPDLSRVDKFRNYREVVTNHWDKFDMVYHLLSDDISRQIFYDRLNYCFTRNPNYLLPLTSNSTLYFERGIIKLSKEEVFIDGGAYIGDSSEEFLRQVNGEFTEIYLFEPENKKLVEFEKMTRGNKDIHIVAKGLWSKSKTLKFQTNEYFPSSSEVSELEGDINVSVISIDEVLDGKSATFIKMDIEGAELEGLKGAKQTIKKYQPTLAICVYHKPLDIIEIPLFIKELVPEYKLYLRHYNNHGQTETVLYAIHK